MRSRTARVMTTLMRNGRDRRSENPSGPTRYLSACYCPGPISGSHQGQRPRGCIATEVILQATIGRIHGCTRTLRRKVRFLLHRGHRPYMALHDRPPFLSRPSLNRGIADMAGPPACPAQHPERPRSSGQLRREGFSGFAQLEFLDFSARRAWQLVNELQTLGYVLLRHLLRLQISDHLRK